MILKNVCFYNEVFEKEVADILIENGKISAIGIIDGEGRDMSGLIALPGFVDIHIHGANGGDCSDASRESLDKISEYLGKNGVTSFCATTMTFGRETLCSIVKTIADYKGYERGAKIAGINLEGPFIAMSKKGAQNPDFVRWGTIDEFNELFEKSNSLVKLITIAPEAFDSADFIKEVSKKCVVSIGHSAADAREAQKAFDEGITHATHLYNAMTPMTHREAGIVGTAIDNEKVFCELICDGGHICPAVLRNTFKMLGENRVCVISDSMCAAGLGAGEFNLGCQPVFVEENGKYAVLKNGTIAASISNLFKEFKNLLSFGIDFKTALKSCTINPARAIGEDDKIGSIATGKFADIVFVDENLEIKEVYINGELA
ncbi:MAG: N-acetylglucosamine-6-phosphate deacetylase [Clostridiales bacterium]|nr:N-acetylglucosamine-6-phosphate deacetylase [Clostridiales bacterium]